MQSATTKTAPQSTTAQRTSGSTSQAPALQRKALRGMSYSSGAAYLSPSGGSVTPMIQKLDDAAEAEAPQSDTLGPAAGEQQRAPDQEEGEAAAGAGTVAHRTPEEADTAIQTHLARYVRGAVREGRQIAGSAQVVDDAGWDTAGQAHYGSRWAPPAGRRNRINGFVDRRGRVWIHRDRGNRGTMIHEAVHKYSNAAMIGESQPLNEGVTEYFTRLVTAQIDPTLRRRNYQANYTTVVALKNYTSEAILASAYFDGAIGTLRDHFNIHGRATTAVNAGGGTMDMIGGALGSMYDVAAGAVGAGTRWNTFTGHCSASRWTQARGMMS